MAHTSKDALVVCICTWFLQTWGFMHPGWRQPFRTRLWAEGIPVGGDRFTLVYTCGKCETRNLIRVNRIAWEKGVVVGKCFG